MNAKVTPPGSHRLPAQGSLLLLLVLAAHGVLARVTEELIDLGTHRVAAWGRIGLQPGDA